MSLGILTNSGKLEMSFTGGNDLLTNVILSVEIAQGSFFLDPTFGMLRRPREKNTAATAKLIEGDVRSALQWLIDVGRATSIAVVMEIDTLLVKTRLKARITVTAAQGNKVTYDKFVEVV
jgi:phage gp46-like protein